MRRLALVPLAISMLLFAPAVSALGLGEIEMQSALNQRLDAEIPIRGVPEDDGSRIIVSLASEEAFRQVGLQRPFSLTRLSFEVKQRNDDVFYVHVTSREPIVEPFLSFLIEVDWPSGNLLREYTVLLDPPVFVSDAPEEEPAQAEPAAVEADTEPAAGEMVDAGEADADAAAATEPDTGTTATDAGVTASDEEVAAVAEPSGADGDFSDTPVFLQVEQEEERAETDARAVAEAETAGEAEPAVEPEPEADTYGTGGGEYGPVQRGEALWNIAGQLKSGDMTIQQMMLALLRYNPEAFVDNNINRLRQGYVLRIPDADAVLSLSAQEAIAQVREQNALWQEYRRALRDGTGRAEQQVAASDEASEAVTGDDADLRIVGSDDGGGATADPDATASAGGSEAQASEELKLAQEQLEATRMEKAELESRVGELEETVGKMERLIELREDQLAKLQEQLRKIEEGAEPAAVLDGEMQDGEAATGQGAEEAAGDEAGDGETLAEDETGAVDGDVATDDAETSADEAGTDAGDADAEDSTGEAATEEATEDDEETVAAGSGEPEATSEQQGDQGVTTVRTRPTEPGILDQVVGVISSVGATIGGVVGGLGLGGLIPEPFVLPAVGAVVVLLLLGLMLAVRRRRGGAEEEFEEEFDSGAESMIAAGGDDSSEDFSALFEEARGDDDTTLAEDDSGLMDSTETGLSAFTGDEETGDADEQFTADSLDLGDLDDTDETMTVPADSGDDDTIAEADVYLAYGLHQQAEDLLKLAIEEQPTRTDYRAKLLEAIYGGGRADEFVQQATAMQEHVADTEADPNWLRVVAMGKELAPSEPLFQQEVDESLKPAGGGMAQPMETDLDLGDGDDDTDLDFSFEDDAGDTGGDSGDSDDTFAQTMMLDSDALASDEAESPAGSDERDASTDDDMDFDLGDFDLGDDETDAASAPASEARTSGDTADDEFDLGDLDLDDSDHGDTDSSDDAGVADDELADFDLGDLEVSEGMEDSAESGGVADYEGDKTQHQIELGDDDGLDFDIGGEDDDGSPAEDDDHEATLAGGLESADIDLGDFDVDDSGFDESDTVLEDDTDLDFDRTDGDAGLQSADDGKNEDVLDLGGDDEFDDVNLEDLTADLTDQDGGLTGPGSDDTAIEAGPGADDTAVEQTATEDTAVEDTDLDLGGLTDAADDEGAGGEDEYGTMLDLARAYIDMGDSESARSALEEVVESGDDRQRSEARSLLDSI